MELLKGSMVLTGDRQGPLVSPLLRQEKAKARATLADIVEVFGKEQVCVELNRHYRHDEAYLLRELMALAKYFGLPLVASNAPLMARRSERPLADAFTCLRHHTTLDEAGHLLEINSERFLKSAGQMRQLFAEIPEAIRQTVVIAERCEFTLGQLTEAGNRVGYRFPDFADVAGWPLSLGEQSTRLRRLTYAGASRLYPVITEEVRGQLEHELALIHQLGFSGYFLIVWDLVEFARGQGILCQGRGSAANSAVCYCLGITKVDPIGQGLLFERFLSANRRTWPDIDIDFPSGERREQVIQYVFRKFGERGAAITANVITYQPRSAFREMSKVLGFPPTVADRFTEISRSPRADSHEQLTATVEEIEWQHPDSELSPQQRENQLEQSFTDAGIEPDHPRRPALRYLYQAVLGLPRHLGQHSGGMIICDRGLDRIVPLQAASMAGRRLIQWDKDDCEELGIIKVDLLGLGMLAAMQDALELCEQRGHPVDLARLPKDDPETFELMTRADTIGTFQVESRAQMATLPIMRPRTFYDVAIEVAIIRPGPIVGDLVHPYLNRRTGHEEIDYIHPDFQPVLERTLGVPLFQEQVLRMAMIIADFDGNEADQLRRALGFKRNDQKMHAIIEKLIGRMRAKRVSQAVQDKIIQSISSFALYGFPESHAISFALIAYASCWLKVHRPAEFFCALINNQPMGFYSVNTLIQDARRHGVRVRAVDIGESDWLTRIEDGPALRLGFHRLKGLRQQTAERIVQQREQRPFEQLSDFLQRVAPNRRERRLLAQAGALNSLPETGHRRQALWQAELPLMSPDLFDQQESSKLSSVALDPMTLSERLNADYQTQGHSTGLHPMKLWRRSIAAELSSERSSDPPLLRASDLKKYAHGAEIQIAGLVICRQRPGTAKGHCFISLEDETGIANLFVPRDTFRAHHLLLSTESFLLARGQLQVGEGATHTLYVLEIQPLHTPTVL